MEQKHTKYLIAPDERVVELPAAAGQPPAVTDGGPRRVSRASRSDVPGAPPSAIANEPE